MRGERNILFLWNLNPRAGFKPVVSDFPSRYHQPLHQAPVYWLLYLALDQCRIGYNKASCIVGTKYTILQIWRPSRILTFYIWNIPQHFEYVNHGVFPKPKQLKLFWIWRCIEKKQDNFTGRYSTDYCMLTVGWGCVWGLTNRQKAAYPGIKVECQISLILWPISLIRFECTLE